MQCCMRPKDGSTTLPQAAQKKGGRRAIGRGFVFCLPRLWVGNTALAESQEGVIHVAWTQSDRRIITFWRPQALRPGIVP